MLGLFLDILCAAPLFAALLLQTSEPDPLILRNFVNISLLLVSWALLRRTIPWFLKREGSALGRTLVLALSSFAVIATLEMTRLHLPSKLVGLTLFVLGSLALEQAMRQRASYWIACLAFFVASAALCILGFQILAEPLRWQPMVFAAAIGLSSLCTQIARSFEYLVPHIRAAKTFAAAFLLSPTLVALLAYTQQLPSYYLASYLILLLAPLTVSPLLTGASSAPTKALFVFPLFIAILVLLRGTLGNSP